jgi:NADH:quinone reductase (non-electrogenic)
MDLQVPSTPSERTRVVVVGAGFAGFTALRRLERTLRRHDRHDDVELVLVTRQFDIPGVTEVAHGVKTVNEALFLRDHLLAQLDHADALPDTEEDHAERDERLTVVAVGAGYTSTELVGQLQRWLHTVASRWERIRPTDVRWLLLDVSRTVLPELGPRLGAAATEILRRRGVDVRLGTTVTAATERTVTLTDGTTVPTRTLIWGAGVVASPLVATLGAETVRGRVAVDAQLRVHGLDDIWAAGDAAAVPDLTKPDGTVTPPTAQHAQRQGKILAHNIAAALGIGRPRRYAHHDLGLVADLGGRDAVANPVGIPLTGVPAKVVTRAYHLLSVPGTANRVRLVTDWALDALLPPQSVRLSSIRPDDALIPAAQRTAIYG